MIFLHLESFENKLFELDFSTFQKACVYDQAPQEGEFFLHGYDTIFFSRFLLLSNFILEMNNYNSTSI